MFCGQCLWWAMPPNKNHGSRLDYTQKSTRSTLALKPSVSPPFYPWVTATRVLWNNNDCEGSQEEVKAVSSEKKFVTERKALMTLISLTTKVQLLSLKTTFVYNLYYLFLHPLAACADIAGMWECAIYRCMCSVQCIPWRQSDTNCRADQLSL